MLSTLQQQALGVPPSQVQTRQLSTFDLEKRSKTVLIPHGGKATIGEVAGCGVISSVWITFPGWFWRHWDPSCPVSPTILKTLIVRFYWDGASAPAVEAPAGDFFGVGLCETANFASAYMGISSGGFFCKFHAPSRLPPRGENVDAPLTRRCS